jgi:hypothetical protein
MNTIKTNYSTEILCLQAKSESIREIKPGIVKVDGIDAISLAHSRFVGEWRQTLKEMEQSQRQAKLEANRLQREAKTQEEFSLRAKYQQTRLQDDSGFCRTLRSQLREMHKIRSETKAWVKKQTAPQAQEEKTSNGSLTVAAG